MRHPIRPDLRTSQQAKEQEQTRQNQQTIPSGMSTDQLRQFFAHISRDPSLKEQVLQAVSADAAALIAQNLGVIWERLGI